MPRKTNDASPDDIDTDGALAPRVRPQQLIELCARGWRGPTPSTATQADELLQRCRRSAPQAEPDDAL
jgi:hypothetical protein